LAIFWKKRRGLQRSWATPPFFLWCCFKKITSWLLTKRTTSKINNNNKISFIRLPATAHSLKILVVFVHNKKEKTRRKKIVKSKLHTLKTKYVLLTKTDNFISTIVTKNKKTEKYPFNWMVCLLNTVLFVLHRLAQESTEKNGTEWSSGCLPSHTHFLEF